MRDWCITKCVVVAFGVASGGGSNGCCGGGGGCGNGGVGSISLSGIYACYRISANIIYNLTSDLCNCCCCCYQLYSRTRLRNSNNLATSSGLIQSDLYWLITSDH